MFRYKLRTLLIVLALGPPVLAVTWQVYQQLVAHQLAVAKREVFVPMPTGIIDIRVDIPSAGDN